MFLITVNANDQYLIKASNSEEALTKLKNKYNFKSDDEFEVTELTEDVEYIG